MAVAARIRVFILQLFMRRISPILKTLSVVLLLNGQVLGYASAPGTYPEEEMKAGNDLEMPKNPYQNGWTGYDFYYEKDPKDAPQLIDSGKMPAFHSLESVSSDRESPEDPQNTVYQAFGSENGQSKPKTTTSSTVTQPTPTKSYEKVMVSPSSSTKDSSQNITASILTTPPTTQYTSTKSMSTTATFSVLTFTTVSQAVTTETHAPIAPERGPESGSDQSAPDNLDLLYGGSVPNAEKKDSMFTLITVNKAAPPARDPPPPQSQRNLLTTLIEKKILSPKLKSGDSFDDFGGLTGYEVKEAQQEKLSADSHESGYEQNSKTNSSKWSEKKESNSSSSKGYAPGTEPTFFTPSAVVPSLNYNQNDRAKTTTSSTAKTIIPNYFPTSPDNYDYRESERENNFPNSPKLSETAPNTRQLNSKKVTQNLEVYDPEQLKEAETLDHWNTHIPTTKNYNQPPNNSSTVPIISQVRGFHGNPSVSEFQEVYDEPNTTRTSSYSSPSTNSGNKYISPNYQPGSEPSMQVPQKLSPNLSSYTGFSDSTDRNSNLMNHGRAPGSKPIVLESPEQPYSGGQVSSTVPTASTYQPDLLDYGARHNNHIGKTPKGSLTGYPSTDDTWRYSSSNNALSPRDPYDHFGTTNHHPTLAPPHSSSQPKHSSRANFEEYPEDEMDSGYGNNDVVIVPLRSTHSTTTTNTEVRAQISEIDRIAELFENSAREPVEYEQKITSESSKGITVEDGKNLQKHFGRNARKCCSCCDEKQPVSRNIETKVEPLQVQQAVDPSRQLGERDPVQNYAPLQSSVGGSAYVHPPVVSSAPPQQTYYQQPFQQYQPQYPQSYPHQQSSCGCQPQPQNCCAPPAPCCLPTIPCCPPIPCCPQPKVCCQPAPVCLPPQQCCSINFKLPTIPICGRACPSCPCRRRVHKSLRLKRHAISSSCHQCSAAGEPWKSVLHHREKRAAPRCSSGFSTMQHNSCGTCGASHLRTTRVKRMGCLPCLGRKKRDTNENSHIRVKRMGCLPCLGRKKRSALNPSGSGCSQCNSLGNLFNRYKRSLFGCSPCAPQPPCGCQGRKKRSVTMKIVKRAPEQCDASCCDYSRCLNRHKKETLVPFM